jgi:hypothetical protein
MSLARLARKRPPITHADDRRIREELCYGPARKDVAMHRTLAILSSLTALFAAGAMGCSSTSGSSSPDQSTEGGAASCDTTTPVSFNTDVIPVFEKSCTLSAVCHGQMGNAAEEDLYLGENMGTTNAATVYSMLVGVTSKEDPAMNLVTAGSTDNSYLWHKVNGDQGNFAADCSKATMMCGDCDTTTPCGGLMPYQGESLATDSPQYLCTIQSWILQGAMNN